MPHQDDARRARPRDRDRAHPPRPQGVALTRWSVPKLRAHLVKSGVADLSETALRHLLEQAGLSFQRTRSWKWSRDPDFAAKAERVLSLYRSPPTGGPVVCFHEMGPGWAELRRPERLRATYKREAGIQGAKRRGKPWRTTTPDPETRYRQMSKVGTQQTGSPWTRSGSVGDGPALRVKLRVSIPARIGIARPSS